MKLILQVTDMDASVVGLTNNLDIVEKIILDAFQAVRMGEEELVKIEYEGTPLYTTRSKAQVEEDEFEYVDNDGNPINADGSEKSHDVVVEAPMFDYDGEYMWLVRDAKEDCVVDVSASEYFLPDVHSLFEAHENIVIATA